MGEEWTMNDTALLIIDVQVGLFDPRWTVANADPLIANLQKLIVSARSANVPVIFVQHSEEEGLVLNTPDWEIHPKILPLPGEIRIHKLVSNSFHETNLKEELDKLGVSHLVIAGLQTDHCINASTRGAHSLGYQVTLVSDAHSTCGDGTLTAEQIIANHNDSLGQLVNLRLTSEVVFPRG